MRTINGNHIMYGSWDIERDRQIFFAILDHFSLFYLSNNLKYQNFEKIKKTPGDIIVLHKCTKSHHHMLYRSWEMERDECPCSCSFWTLLFYPLNHPKNENFKKKKTTTKEPGDVIILHKCTKNMGLWYTVLEIWRVTDVIVIFQFGLFFPFLLP